jgi:hypothetical protein
MSTSQQLHLLQRQEMEKDGKMLTKAALTMPRDISSAHAHLNQGFRLGFMQVFNFLQFSCVLFLWF